jgi:hypothetical protein
MIIATKFLNSIYTNPSNFELINLDSNPADEIIVVVIPHAVNNTPFVNFLDDSFRFKAKSTCLQSLRDYLIVKDI